VWLYVATFLGATLFSLLLVPAVREYARSRQIHDNPGGHKSHVTPVPYLGGVAMALSFSAAMVLGVAVWRSARLENGELNLTLGNLITQGDGLVRELAVVLGVALLFSLMGLVDDLRGLSPWFRFLVGLGLSVSVVTYGISLDSPLPNCHLGGMDPGIDQRLQLARQHRRIGRRYGSGCLGIVLLHCSD